MWVGDKGQFQPDVDLLVFPTTGSFAKNYKFLLKNFKTVFQLPMTSNISFRYTAWWTRWNSYLGEGCVEKRHLQKRRGMERWEVLLSFLLHEGPVFKVLTIRSQRSNAEPCYRENVAIRSPLSSKPRPQTNQSLRHFQGKQEHSQHTGLRERERESCQVSAIIPGSKSDLLLIPAHSHCKWCWIPAI